MEVEHAAFPSPSTCSLVANLQLPHVANDHIHKFHMDAYVYTCSAMFRLVEQWTKYPRIEFAMRRNN